MKVEFHVKTLKLEYKVLAIYRLNLRLVCQ